jgi:3',5'-cyclic AMP phosphodiesterase CpdA
MLYSPGRMVRHMNFFFIQLADPQFGMYAALSGLDDERLEEHRSRGLNVKASPKTTGFARETELYESAIASANRLAPEFVITCGDMVHDADDPDQFDELMRITDKLDSGIPMHWVAGNHDVGNVVTSESLSGYRDRFGRDDYFFDHQGSRFVVLNSNIPFDPSQVPHEWKRQREFAEDAIGEAHRQGADHILVFVHHPPFLRRPDEEDSFIVVPQAQRRVLLETFHRHRVSAVFAGHWHRNVYGRDGDLEMVTTGSVGYPLGDDPSGLRVVRVYQDRVEHDYFALDAVPDSVKLGEPR